MYLLNWQKLRKGDILLSRSDTDSSRQIRERTRSQYSHAMLYIGTLHCLHSNVEGVEAKSIQRVIFNNEEDVIAFRFIETLSNADLEKILTSAQKKIGTEYSIKEAVLSEIQRSDSAKVPNRQFCTRFVAQAYEEAGFPIVPNSDYCTPKDIFDSKLLTRVTIELYEASIQEIEFAYEKETILTKERDSIKYIFNQVKNLANIDIQTFEQLAFFLYSNPKYDDKVIEFLNSSDYLKIIDFDIIDNPWHYDYDHFIKYYTDKEQQQNVAYVFKTNEPLLRDRYAKSLTSLKPYFIASKLKYFSILIEHFQKLNEYSLLRENVAVKILNG